MAGRRAPAAVVGQSWPGSRPTRRWWPVVGAVAGAANANFLLHPFVGSPLAPSSTAISLLSAPGQPAAGAFRAADLTAGVLALALAAGTAATGSARGSGGGGGAGRRVAAVAETAGLAAFGVGTVGAAAITPTPGRVRRSHTAGSTAPARSPRDVVHDAVSILASVGTVVGCTALPALVGRSRVAGTGSRGPLTAALLAVAVVAVTVAEAATDVAGVRSGSGWLQRAEVAAASGWLAVAGSLLSPPGPSGPDTSDPDAGSGPDGGRPDAGGGGRSGGGRTP